MGVEGLEELTVIEAAARMRRGDLAAETYAETLLGRCRAMADLNAFITIDEEAVRAAARAADIARKTGRALGALHGVPMAVKDNIDVAGLPATAGTPALATNIPRTHAPIVEKLVTAGAIVLGKANMHELAAGATTKNARFGFARNPYDTSRVPGGSSGGTAVAVGARLAPCGLGTDTGGSNRVPAAYCGVVGFRPSTHRWSQAGMIANSTTRDTAGPMARTLVDCALLDTIVTGCDPRLERVALGGLRLGVSKSDFWAEIDNEIALQLEGSLALLRDAGVELVDIETKDVFPLTRRAGVVIAMHEHLPTLSAYLAETGSGLTAARVFSEVASPDVKAFLDTHIGKITAADYDRALNVDRPALQAAYENCFSHNRLDAIIFPTSPIPPPKISEGETLCINGKTVSTLFTIVRNTDPGSVAGIPGLSLPAGTTSSGLPIGLEIDGPAGSDRRLLAIGAALEAVLPKSRPPAR